MYPILHFMVWPARHKSSPCNDAEMITQKEVLVNEVQGLPKLNVLMTVLWCEVP